VKEKEQEAKQIQRRNVELQSEIERTRKECDTQVLLLQEDNETTRIRLHEVQEELDSLRTETDGRNPEFDELSRDFEELKSKSRKNENEFKKLKDSQIETVRDMDNEKNKRLKLEKDFEQKTLELQNSQKEIEKFRGLLITAEEKFENKSKRVGELEGVCKSSKENDEHREAKYSQELASLEAKIQNYQNEINEIRGKLDGSNGHVLGLNKELKKRMKVEEQVLKRIESLESSLGESWYELLNSNSQDAQSNIDESTQDKTSVLDSIGTLCKRVEILNRSLREEKEKSCSLEQSLQTQQSTARRCSLCERRKNESSSLAQDLEDVKVYHRKEMDRLQESMNNESQALKSQAEEMKLKLTSKVILLQSDVSELNAKHEQELGQVNEQHKKEVRGKEVWINLATYRRYSPGPVVQSWISFTLG
jgi:chromosome segregation ATPase